LETLQANFTRDCVVDDRQFNLNSHPSNAVNLACNNGVRLASYGQKPPTYNCNRSATLRMVVDGSYLVLCRLQWHTQLLLTAYFVPAAKLLGVSTYMTHVLSGVNGRLTTTVRIPRCVKQISTLLSHVNGAKRK